MAGFGLRQAGKEWLRIFYGIIAIVIYNCKLLWNKKIKLDHGIEYWDMVLISIYLKLEELKKGNQGPCSLAWQGSNHINL